MLEDYNDFPTGCYICKENDYWVEKGSLSVTTAASHIVTNVQKQNGVIYVSPLVWRIILRRASDHDGFKISHDLRGHQQVLERARKWLLTRRELFISGTNQIADHLSDDYTCPRKVILRNRDVQAAVSEGLSPPDDLEEKLVWMFGLGHAVQDLVVGADSEETIWSEAEQVMYSPDGYHVEGLPSLVEVKSTMRSPLTKAQNEAGMSIEDRLYEDNPRWWEYILAVMYLEGVTEYHLEVFRIASRTAEGYKIEATPERIEQNWKLLSARRKLRREHVRQGTLPPVSERMGAWECDGCVFASREPCMSEIPGVE